jgi:hypothetical protein
MKRFGSSPLAKPAEGSDHPLSSTQEQPARDQQSATRSPTLRIWPVQVIPQRRFWGINE